MKTEIDRKILNLVREEVIFLLVGCRKLKAMKVSQQNKKFRARTQKSA